LAAGDVDLDGDLDLVAAGSYGHGGSPLSILLGRGDGTFDNEAEIPLSDPTSSFRSEIAIGDVNGDGDLDLLVAVQPQTGPGISVLLGSTGSTFTQGSQFAVGGFSETEFVLGDLNGDGRLDIVLSRQSENTVSVRIGNGDGTFGAAMQFAVGSGAVKPALGDLDGDGDLDVVTVSSSGAGATILRGAGDGTFANRIDLSTEGLPRSVVTADIDRDGDLDLIFTGEASGSTGVDLVSVRLNRRIGSSSPPPAGSAIAQDRVVNPLGTNAAPRLQARSVDEAIDPDSNVQFRRLRILERPPGRGGDAAVGNHAPTLGRKLRASRHRLDRRPPKSLGE
jgi:hypothetical protein